MSYKDTRQLRKDKIEDIVRSHGALSTDDINKVYNDGGMHDNVKTTQRAIEDMLIETRLKKNPSVGRTQTYSLAEHSNGEASVHEYFKGKFWSELFRIRREYAKYVSTYVSPKQGADAPSELTIIYAKLRSLVSLLPGAYQNKLKPKMLKFEGAKGNHKLLYLCFEQLLSEVASVAHEAFSQKM
jgi:hypothetical protein